MVNIAYFAAKMKREREDSAPRTPKRALEPCSHQSTTVPPPDSQSGMGSSPPELPPAA